MAWGHFVSSRLRCVNGRIFSPASCDVGADPASATPQFGINSDDTRNSENISSSRTSSIFPGLLRTLFRSGNDEPTTRVSSGTSDSGQENSFRKSLGVSMTSSVSPNTTVDEARLSHQQQQLDPKKSDKPFISGESAQSSIPVQFENYSKEYTQLISQDNFDGFRLEAGKAVNKHLQINHSLFLGTSLREAGYLYQFGPTLGLEDDSAFLVARYSNDNSVTLRGMKRFPKRGTEFRISGQSCLENEMRNAFEIAADQQGVDWAAALKACWQGAWILNSSFSQVVSRRLQMGGDLTWVANGSTMGTVGLRYNMGEHILSGTLSRQPNFKAREGILFNSHGCKLQYFRKVSDRLHLGTELDLALEPSATSTVKESALRLGYDYFFRQARIQGLVDTGGKVSVLAQDSSGFGFSGMIDYWKGDYRFGFMMQLLPPPTDESQETSVPGVLSSSAV